MTNSHTMYHVKRKLSDFDACSLYPSAMKRIPGYLRGEPQILTNLTYQFLEQQSGPFIRTGITQVGNRRRFPLVSKIPENGVRAFTNEMEGEVIYINQASLEDAITFQEIKFEVIDGYTFNEDWGDTINHIIEHLYEKRRALTRDKNPG